MEHLGCTLLKKVAPLALTEKSAFRNELTEAHQQAVFYLMTRSQGFDRIHRR